MKQAAATPGMENLAYLETMLDRYHTAPDTVPEAWRQYFAAAEGDQRNGSSASGPTFQPRSLFHSCTTSAVPPSTMLAARRASLQDRVNQLIRNHRTRGHLIAALDPLGTPRPCPPELELAFYGFTESDLDFVTSSVSLPHEKPLAIRDIFQLLRNTYCRSIGAQFTHIDDVAVRQWLQSRMESNQNRLSLTRPEQVRILQKLTDAVVFEEFVRKKFLGAKSFSLEGCESLIPLLDLALESAGEQGVSEVVFGMAHRGRLNVLTNILGKNPSQVFHAFADTEPEKWIGRGDVKYHLGHSGKWVTAAGRNLHLTLCFNPSHLEYINPVVLGRVRARQDRLADVERRHVLGVMIHGDAALAGEGIVQETLNMSRLRGYQAGGVLHIVINNQIGFTATPDEGRSTIYATDVARMLQVPIFHVNGEDPEAVAQVVRIALDFRREFQQDVFIDMYGYRRWGHNETDEPAFTQPVLYRAIQKRKPVRETYLEQLLKLDGITAEEADKISTKRQAALEAELNEAKNGPDPVASEDSSVWRGYFGGAETADATVTQIPAGRLTQLLQKLCDTPAWLHVHPKLQKLLETRRTMAVGEHPLDWAAGEALAFASLATEGVRIRLSGQDSGRGTFSHRHAILHDNKDGTVYLPLQHLASGQAPVEIRNSPLSEAGVLGFDYGYSLDCPDGLIMWEAQFGDFVNCAQVILDQFIASGEDKWRVLSGITLLLPHGFEGMGPEHSSARLERFLTLAAEDNMQVAQPTTPAQMFHLLRRQALRRWRKPLVIFTPKSLLRHPQAVSTMEEFTNGAFARIIGDATVEAGRVRRILLCSGKVYYDLAAHRAASSRDDVAIIRLEQLYPLRWELLEAALKPYADQTPLFWVQEAPANMGAWNYLYGRFNQLLSARFSLEGVSRPESASPATGSANAHKLEQARLIARAFGEPEPKTAAALNPKKSSVKSNPAAETVPAALQK
jgi:2-oxoglutarate dehydrogenase E1 component